MTGPYFGIPLRHFDISEFDCKETGENGMDPDFLYKLDALRDVCGFPFVITSGYRSVNHSVERAKFRPGMHTKGIAADIKRQGADNDFLLLKHAFDEGFTGVGVAESFIHLDIRDSTPVVWTYK